MEAGIKGVNCITTLAFAREVMGARWSEILDTLPEPARWHATRRIMSIEWVPLNEWYPVEEAIFDRICDQREEAYFTFTKRVVESEFNSVYRAFLKVPGPSYVLDKAARIFGTYFNTGGVHVAARPKEPTQAAPYIIDVHLPGRYPLLLTGIAAGFDAILSLTRAKNLRVWLSEQRVNDDGIFARVCMAWDA